MKCLVFLVLYLASLVSDVCSLGLAITTLDGYNAVVHWTREDSDPDPLSFDLRYVIPPYYDVGLAQANLSPSPIESSGNITVQFPQDGKYLLIAVAGPNNFQIGRTAVIEVSGKTNALTSLQIPTFSSTPTPTPTPSKTPAPSQDPSSIPSPSKTFAPFGFGLQKKPNVPAIVLGILGGVLLIALLIFAMFYLCRRHRMKNNRISFHGDRMVQHRSSDRHNPSVGRAGRLGGVIIPYPFLHPDSSLGSTRRTTNTQDLEQGLSVPPPALRSLPPNLSESRPSTPLPPGHGHTVPPPRGPRDRSKSVRQAESARTSRANDEPTARQRRLADKLAEVEKQIEKAKSEPKPSPSTVVLLDDLKLQKVWLVKQQNSMWALEKIDTLPPGYSRYMA